MNESPPSSPEDPRPISQVLLDLKAVLPPEKITLSDLLEALHERGIGMMLFIFALPAALPLPGLGVNVIIALPLLLLSVQQAMGRHSLWVPEKIKSKSISKERFDKMIEAALPYVKKIEFIIRPRLGFITRGVFSNVIGLAGLVMTLSVCVPLPLTNTVPAFGIALMALGVVMRDGLAVLAGMMIGLIWVTAITLAISFLGLEALDMIKEGIKSFLL
ncbi:MAG: exopolysaccharide biosynthesis protein [Alphaproteobacteria bacterium]|nr:exopolysaccharide biosynthesis protein [Alphaproteobacteria bacterium]